MAYLLHGLTGSHAQEGSMPARRRLGWGRGWRLGLPLAGALAAGGLLPPAQAQNYPSRAITMVVPFAAGGLTDVPARVLAAMMQGRIAQRNWAPNKPGGDRGRSLCGP